MIMALGKGIKISCLFLGFLILSQGIYAQEEENWDRNRSIPDMLRRPDRGESPRFPRDMAIGELGQGEAPGAAYFFARNLLSALISENGNTQTLRDSNPVLTRIHFDEIGGIRPRNFRIGGGRVEPDGNVSFLVRFIGLEESITGELYLRQTGISVANPEGRWLLDDLILEEKRLLRDIRDDYRFDFSPYERFF